MLNILSVSLASGIFLIAISALRQFCFPHVRKGEMYAQEHRSLPSSEIKFAVNESLDPEKVNMHTSLASSCPAQQCSTHLHMYA